MATTLYAAASKQSLSRALTSPATHLHENCSFYRTLPALFTRAHSRPANHVRNSLSVTAYHTSGVRIRRPSEQVTSTSRLYAASASEAPGVRSVPVQVAKELVDAGHKYVDVRTPEEFQSGHAEGAINVPYMLKQGGGMTKNQDFLKDMRDQFDLDDELVIGCLSGKRSMLAATELVREEFTNVTDVGGGFQAWQQSGLSVTNSAGVA